MITCDFCGKSKDNVDFIIIQDNVGICDKCVDECAKIIKNERANKKEVDMKNNAGLNPAIKTKLKYSL